MFVFHKVKFSNGFKIKYTLTYGLETARLGILGDFNCIVIFGLFDLLPQGTVTIDCF